MSRFHGSDYKACHASPLPKCLNRRVPRMRACRFPCLRVFTIFSAFLYFSAPQNPIYLSWDICLYSSFLLCPVGIKVPSPKSSFWGLLSDSYISSRSVSLLFKNTRQLPPSLPCTYSLHIFLGAPQNHAKVVGVPLPAWSCVYFVFRKTIQPPESSCWI